jgi:uncharacterized membrane protein YgcG
MNNLYDVLEICLLEVENGADLEAVLAHYPDLADELRPVLQIAIHARRMAVPAPASEVVRRNRTKLIQYAAQMRYTKPAATMSWFPTFQRLALVLVLLVLFFVSGTSLVRASSSALPGDSLYSVKRSWEDVSLFFTFNTKAHAAMEVEYENERLDEIHKLFASGRPAKVDFVGLVTRQNGDGWRIANIVVKVLPQTTLPNQTLTVGMAVHVIGTTDGNGIVIAERIDVLSVNAPLPEVTDDQPASETEQPQATSQPENGNPTQESGTGAPEIEATITPQPVTTPQIESFESTLNSIDQDVWTINNMPVNVANAEIVGIPVVGAQVRVEGYYGSDGVFVAVRVEILNGGSSNDNENLNTNNDGSPNANNNDNSGGSNGNDGGGNSNDGHGGSSGGTDDNGGGGGGGNDNGGG